MEINERLNLVSKIVRKGGVAFVHAVPLPYEVVEEHCVLLGNLFSNFMGLVGTIGSPRVAAMMLRKRLKADRIADEKAGIENNEPTLLDAMLRTSTFIYLSEKGWESVPVVTALKHGLLSEEEWREVEGEVVFFMVSSAIQRANLVEATVGKVLAMYSAQLTSSTVTAYKDSLPTSTTPEPIHALAEPQDKQEQSFIAS